MDSVYFEALGKCVTENGDIVGYRVLNRTTDEVSDFKVSEFAELCEKYIVRNADTDILFKLVEYDKFFRTKIDVESNIFTKRGSLKGLRLFRYGLQNVESTIAYLKACGWKFDLNMTLSEAYQCGVVVTGVLETLKIQFDLTMLRSNVFVLKDIVKVWDKTVLLDTPFTISTETIMRKKRMCSICRVVFEDDIKLRKKRFTHICTDCLQGD